MFDDRSYAPLASAPLKNITLSPHLEVWDSDHLPHLRFPEEGQHRFGCSFIPEEQGHSKWFDSDKHAKLTAHAYDTFVAIVTYDYSNVVIRAPSSFHSTEAIRAIPTAVLLRFLGAITTGCMRPFVPRTN